MHVGVIADAFGQLDIEELTTNEEGVAFGFAAECYYRVEIEVQEETDVPANIVIRIVFAETAKRKLDVGKNPNYVSDLFTLQSALRFSKLRVYKDAEGIVAPCMEYAVEYPFMIPDSPLDGAMTLDDLQTYADSFGSWCINMFSLTFNEARMVSKTIVGIAKGEKVHPEIGKLFEEETKARTGQQFVM